MENIRVKLNEIWTSGLGEETFTNGRTDDGQTTDEDQ